MKLTLLEEREYTAYVKKFDFLKEIRNKTILITGANGMLGSGIIKWLLLENELYDASIRIFASTRSPKTTPKYLEENDSITYCMFGSEEELLCDVSLDYIIHGASPTRRNFFMSNPVETFRVIVDATENLLELARNKGCRFLYLSSMDVYGTVNVDYPLAEDFVGSVDSLNIRNCYPLGKKAGEFLCKAYCKEYGVDTVIIRPASIQGLLQPYDEMRVFNEILQCIIEKKDLVLKTDGRVKKCFLYSLDAISAILTVLTRGEKGTVYNATNPESFMSIKDLAERIFKRYCPELKVIYDIEDNAVNGFLPTFSFVQDNGKLEALNWKPIKSVEDIYAIDKERFSEKAGGKRKVKVAIGSDRCGMEYKDRLVQYLRRNSYDVYDVGTHEYVPCDSPVFAAEVGKLVVSGECDYGVLVCATGTGMAIAANKIRGIMCGIGYDDDVTRKMREHNDTNVIAFGATHMKYEDVEKRLGIFLNSNFKGQHHGLRVKQIRDLEEGKVIEQSPILNQDWKNMV